MHSAEIFFYRGIKIIFLFYAMEYQPWDLGYIKRIKV
jgi:hypothetical protein